MSTHGIDPVSIKAGKNSTMIVTKEGQLFSCGQNWGGSDQKDFTVMPLP
jgi:alpha-tubulin suppressor-like RCC1 family protein